MFYLIAQVSTFLVVTLLVGLSLGWLLWGELARRIRTEAALLQSKLADLEVRHWATLSERDAFEKKMLDREGEIAGLRKRVLEPVLSAQQLDEKISAAVTEKEELLAQLRDQQRGTLALLDEREQTIIELRANLAAVEAREKLSSARTDELESAATDQDHVLAELKSQFAEQEARQQEVVSELEQKLESLFGQHQILAGRISEKEAEIARLQTRLSSASATLAAASREQESALSAATAEIERLRQVGALLRGPLPHDEVTRIAHGYAQARNFQGGSERDDWSRAENEVRLRMVRDYLANATSSSVGAPA